MTATRTPTRTSWMGRLTAALGRTHSRPAPARRTRLGVVALEDRRTPSTATLSHGVLTITGTRSDDVIIVGQFNGVIEAVDGATGAVIAINGQQTADASAVRRVVVNAGAGNDTVRLDGPTAQGKLPVLVPAVVNGGTGNDVLVGGSNKNSLNGGAGRDVLIGLSGHDVLAGGTETDTFAAPYDRLQPAIGGFSPADFRALSGESRVIVNTLKRMARTEPDELARRIAYLGQTADGRDVYQIALFGMTPGGQLYQSAQQVAYNGFWDDTEAMPATSGEFWANLYIRAVKQQAQQDGQNYQLASYVVPVLTGLTA